MNDCISNPTSTCRLGIRVTPRRPGFDFEGLEHEVPRAWHPAGIGPTAFLAGRLRAWRLNYRPETMDCVSEPACHEDLASTPLVIIQRGRLHRRADGLGLPMPRTGRGGNPSLCARHSTIRPASQWRCPRSRYEIRARRGEAPGDDRHLGAFGQARERPVAVVRQRHASGSSARAGDVYPSADGEDVDADTGA